MAQLKAQRAEGKTTTNHKIGHVVNWEQGIWLAQGQNR
jgi:hypothetical protein